MAFTIDNADHKYNLINPNGLYRYLQDVQEIESDLVIGGERLDMGSHYFQKAEAKDGAFTAEITAKDRVLWLGSENWENGEDGPWTLAAAVAAVQGSDTVLDIPASLGSRLMGKSIPNGTTKREVTRFLAQAARCPCWVRRDWTFVFRELTVGSSVDTLDGTNMETMDGVSVSQPVDKVVLRVVDEFHWNSFLEEFQTKTTEHIAEEGLHVLTVQNPCAYDEAKDGGVLGYEAVFDGGLSETVEVLGPAWQ